MEILNEISQIKPSKTTQGIKIFPTHKRQKHHQLQQPEESATSTVISPGKKGLAKTAINENNFREPLLGILSLTATGSNLKVENIVKNIDYLAAQI
ncbi:hypothetical protein ACE1CI_28845 [Aerosakkonemataceae cyanobacterium BLCC-F50]|uniref:Uncharacterized protein n=1 Tax=Floridaenema flaviceps BLCC-F50 TaxID=3153642 RepID=A0ABV4XZ54_9CYAN